MSNTVQLNGHYYKPNLNTTDSVQPFFYLNNNYNHLVCYYVSKKRRICKLN